jgi:hypothetical protein
LPITGVYEGEVVQARPALDHTRCTLYYLRVNEQHGRLPLDYARQITRCGILKYTSVAAEDGTENSLIHRPGRHPVVVMFIGYGIL